MSAAWHRLTDVDVEARTATCSICGPTGINVRPRGQAHQCKARRRMQDRSRVKRGRRAPRQYTIAPDVWEQMQLTKRCGICEATETLRVDHDHSCCPERNSSCGSCVRGWLCHACNVGLGFFRDDPDKLSAAIDYLRDWSALKNSHTLAG